MSWARLDDRFWSHPKVLEAGNTAVGVFARALCYCSSQHTDGFVSEYMARFIEGRKKVWEKLVQAGLISRVEGGEAFDITGRRDAGNRVMDDVTVMIPGPGYFIEDFLHFNLTREEYESKRLKRARAGALGGQANAEAIAKQSTALPTRPDPYKNSEGRNEYVDAAFHKLLRALGPVDEEAMSKLRGFEARLPESSVARVTESVITHRPRNRVGYALKALSSELTERNSA